MNDIKLVMQEKSADQMTDDEVIAALRVTDVYAARWNRDNSTLAATSSNPFILQGIPYRREVWRRHLQ